MGGENNFQIKGFRSTAESDVREGQADLDFVKTVVCTDLAQLLGAEPQETYRNITFRNFPDPDSRTKIKAYLDLLPPDFASAIKNIVFVEDARFVKGGEAGYADSVSKSIVLQESFYAEPAVFFMKRRIFMISNWGSMSVSRRKKANGQRFPGRPAISKAAI